MSKKNTPPKTITVWCTVDPGADWAAFWVGDKPPVRDASGAWIDDPGSSNTDVSGAIVEVCHRAFARYFGTMRSTRRRTYRLTLVDETTVRKNPRA